MRQATHVEPDDVNPGQSVAKNATGDVIGKGASPEEALADARARRGEPYVEEVPAEPARPTEAGTNEQLAVKEKTPPAEAAKPEPAASGRDAASETPKEQTFRLPKTGHELTGTLGTRTSTRRAPSCCRGDATY